MKKKELSKGDNINGRIITEYLGKGKYKVQCPVCKSVSIGYITLLKDRNCGRCNNSRYCKRYSGLNYTNPKTKIAEIKEKYKNGIPEDIINQMLGI